MEFKCFFVGERFDFALASESEGGFFIFYGKIR